MLPREVLTFGSLTRSLRLEMNWNFCKCHVFVRILWSQVGTLVKKIKGPRGNVSLPVSTALEELCSPGSH